MLEEFHCAVVAHRHCAQLYGCGTTWPRDMGLDWSVGVVWLGAYGFAWIASAWCMPRNGKMRGMINTSDAAGRTFSAYFMMYMACTDNVTSISIFGWCTSHEQVSEPLGGVVRSSWDTSTNLGAHNDLGYDVLWWTYGSWLLTIASYSPVPTRAIALWDAGMGALNWVFLSFRIATLPEKSLAYADRRRAAKAIHRQRMPDVVNSFVRGFASGTQHRASTVGSALQ